MLLKDYSEMKPERVYLLGKLRLCLVDGVLLSRYPRENFWCEFSEDDEYFKKWENEAIIETPMCYEMYNARFSVQEAC